MIIVKDDMKTETRTHARGGEGEITMLHCADSGDMDLPNLRLFSRIAIPPGSSIGLHRHEQETEYYLILKGSGVVTEDSGEEHVNAGDLVITRNGESHSIRNVSLEPLEFIAVIILD